MRAVIQRVSKASVTVDGHITGQIGKGLCVLLGIEESDGQQDIEWLSGKISRLRILNDEEGVMSLSVAETGGDILIVSQFTLYADTHKGNRPSYIKAARPEKAIPIYEAFISRLEKDMKKQVQKGVFGAMMEVSLTNDGPVTIIIDTKKNGNQ